MKYCCAYLLVFLVTGVQWLGAQANNALHQEIRTYLDTEVPSDFSGVILVAHRDSILEERAYGFANREYKVPNATDHQFNIASITKMFTSVATLQLHQAGKIELHQPIQTYLPNYPNAAVRDSVTVHQLLTHTAGTQPFYGKRFLETDKLRYRNVADFLPLFVNDPLAFTPGSQYKYNGSGFVILGLIIEAVSGQSYYDYLQQHVFQAAGMEYTKALAVDAIRPKRATGYTQHVREDKSLSHNWHHIAKASPGGGHYATAHDLFLFSQAVHNCLLLDEKTTRLMLEPKVKGYNTHLGYGIDIDQRYAQTIVGHSGGWYGVRGELMHFADSKHTVVILGNVDDDGTTRTSIVAAFFKDQIAGHRP